MQNKRRSKKVSVVMVTHNSDAVVERSLESIPDNITTFVVDNLSTDNTITTAENAAPKANIIKSEVNLGFGRANNVALEKVQTEFALLLNPDTSLDEGSIEKLLQTADKHPEAAIISPVLYLEDGSIQQSYKNDIFTREKRGGKFIELSGDACAESLSGAVMLLRMSCFKKKKFFDPKVFLFYEDDDICMQARKNGYSLVITPDARVMHMMGKSSPPTLKYIYIKNWHMMWSRLYMQKKYFPKEYYAMSSKLMIVCALKSLGYVLKVDKPKMMKYIAQMMAIMAFAMGKKSC